MTTESLIVELTGRTAQLEADLARVNNKLDNTEKKTGLADKAMSGMSKTASSVAAALKKTAVATAALTTAATATIAVMADQAKQLQINSDLMNMSVESTQMWAAATKTVGIDLEKLGDISKDTEERLGAFLVGGESGFDDFVKVMGYTETQAMAVAKELQELSGPEVLQEMVSQMESAGAASESMSWALEGMGSDATRLIPILENNSEKLNELNDDYIKFNRTLSEQDIQALSDLDDSFGALAGTFKNTMSRISVQYADMFEEMNQKTREQLTAIGDEFASGAFNKRFTAAVNAISDSWDTAFGDVFEISDDFSGDFTGIITAITKAWFEFALTLPIEMKKAVVTIEGMWNEMGNAIALKMAETNLAIQEGLDLVGAGNVEAAERAIEAIELMGESSLAESGAELARLEEEKQAILAKFDAENEAADNIRTQYKKDHIERMQQINDENEAKDEPSDGDDGDPSGLNETEIADYEEMLMTKEELRAAALESEINQVREAYEALAELRAEEFEQGLIDEEEYQEKLNDLRESASSKVDELNSSYISLNSDKESSDNQYLDNALSAGDALASNSETLQKGMVVANAATAIVRQYADLPIYAAIPASIAVAATAATQFASIGSGSLATSSTSVTDTSIDEENVNVEVSNNDTSGTTTNVVLSWDTSIDDSEIGTAISNVLTANAQSGIS